MSIWVQSAMGPVNCVFQTIIAPKKLAFDNKSRCAKDAKCHCLICRKVKRCNNAVGFRFLKNTVRVLPDLSQTRRKVWLFSSRLSRLKPIAISCLCVCLTPIFFEPKYCHLICKHKARQWVGCRKFWGKAIFRGATFDISPHMGGLFRFIFERNVVLRNHHVPDIERAPAKTDARTLCHAGQSHDGQVTVSATD